MDEPNPLTRFQKLLATLFVVVPKLVVACILTFVGTYFVFLSESNTDLILNCLAMTFVVELDELAYATISSEFSKKEVQNVVPLVLHSSSVGPLGPFFGVFPDWVKRSMFRNSPKP